MAELDLHRKYRPTKFDDIVGNKAIIKSIKGNLGKNPPHSYIFTGPSGCGKTTFSRILAKELGCDDSGILEVDASSNTGVDDMRAITDTLRYKSFGESPNKAIILDEAHMLSKSAWNSLLKNIEEPPEHVFWLVLSTEPSKIPHTIKTRCVKYEVKPLSTDELFDLLADVADAEELETPDEILDLAAAEAYGSPRQALVNLSQVASCTKKSQAADLLATGASDPQLIELCRYLLKDDLNWSALMKYVSAFKDMNPESIRLPIVSYFTKVAMNAKDDADLGIALEVLDKFSQPFNQSDKMAPVLLALGELYLND